MTDQPETILHFFPHVAFPQGPFVPIQWVDVRSAKENPVNLD